MPKTVNSPTAADQLVERLEQAVVFFNDYEDAGGKEPLGSMLPRPRND